uniref:hypothetical protein n=1 Tax=Burkholderia anthina TaxID=179879 RepID=UPI00158E3B5A|nr:hypothetical protein [Burkholderia anthina]
MVERLVMAGRHRNGAVKVLKAYRVCVKKKSAGSPERTSFLELHQFRFLGVRAARLRIKYFEPDDDPASLRLLPLSRSRQAPFSSFTGLDAP